MVKFLLSSLLILFVQNSFAEQFCEYRNFENQFGPVRNQGEVGWCYAFAGADLIGAALGLKPPDMVSAFDVAVGYYSLDINKAKKNIGTLGLPEKAVVPFTKAIERIAKTNEAYKGLPFEKREGGYFAQAIGTYSLRGGICLESKFPSEESGISDFITKKIKAIESTHNFVRPPCTTGGAGQYSAKAQIESLRNDAYEIAAKLIDQEANKKCEPRAPLTAPILSKSLSKENGNVLAKINERLDKKSPVGISYNPCGLVENKNKIENEETRDECSHASVVVGRQFNKKTNSCEYLVRNSWGTDCSGYRKDIRENCKQGSFWVSESELNEIVDGVTWIQK